MNEIGAIKYRLEQGYTMTRYGSKEAMIEQLITDTEYLLSKVENNEVLDLVSERDFKRDDFVWYKKEIWIVMSVSGEIIAIDKVKGMEAACVSSKDITHVC